MTPLLSLKIKVPALESQMPAILGQGTSIDRGLHEVTVTEVPLGNLPSDVTRYRIYLPTTSEFSPTQLPGRETRPLNESTLA